jgi:hypothetical protein
MIPESLEVCILRVRCMRYLRSEVPLYAPFRGVVINFNYGGVINARE